MADEVAEAVALRLQPDMNAQSKAYWCDKMGFNIAKRLAIIQIGTDTAVYTLSLSVFALLIAEAVHFVSYLAAPSDCQ